MTAETDAPEAKEQQAVPENTPENRLSRAEKAAQAAVTPVAAVETPAAPTGGVTLTRGEETVTAYKPGTVTKLKAQGWKVDEK